MTTDTTPAAAQLRDIREQWGDLLAAIAQPPRAEWPPRQPSEQHLTAEPEPDAPHVGRLPLTLREHPAPLNLDALDAALSIEEALFALADRIAAVVQRPVRVWDVGTWGDPDATLADPEDIADVDRWHTATVRDLGRAQAASPGSRALGLHWAAVWIEDRLTATEPTDLHRPLRGVLRDHAEQTIAACVRDMARALGRDGRDTVLPAPCPWCGGELTARTDPDATETVQTPTGPVTVPLAPGDPAAMTVTCDTGPTCTAPTVYDTDPDSRTFGRRMWRGADLCGLYGALSAKQHRATA